MQKSLGIIGSYSSSHSNWFCSLWGYQLTGSVGLQVTKAVTGANTDKVMTYYIFDAKIKIKI